MLRIDELLIDENTSVLDTLIAGGVEIKLITTAENEISLLVSDADVDPACGLLRKTYLH